MLKIRALASRHGIECLIVGGVGVCIIMLFNLLRPGTISIIEIFLISACVAAIFVGFLKTQEPFYSFTFTEQILTYHHKYGDWHLERDNFVISGIPFVENDLQNLELNAVGIKLKDAEAFLSHISVRLAGKLLIEQRHFFMQVIQKYCKSGDCPSEWLVEDTVYTAPSGQQFKGLLAMFANRTKHLKQLTGYDLLLPASVLDTDIWQFSNKLNHWKRNPSDFIASQL